MKINSIITLIGASLFSLFLASCRSEPETVREVELEQQADTLENEADRVRIEGEQRADAQERRVDAIEAQPDATRDAAEQRADALEQRADEVRDAQ
jgi:V/A-type H+/Na+-transporting ATPase subunit G/H